MEKKAAYEQPKLTVIGDVGELTRATISGWNADQTIYYGEPIYGKTSP